MFDINVAATSRLINFCEAQSRPPRVLFASSGAVYGNLPRGLQGFEEISTLAVTPSAANAAYAEGKRVAEFFLAEAHQRGVCESVIARMFAFSGRYLPLDRHFAIGNFVRDAVTNSEITITGDGTAVRSYLDGRDMAEWLLRCCEVGEPGFPYHIGSDQPISILELAELVATRAAESLGRQVSVRVLGESRYTDGVSRYVPETTETRRRLNVVQRISLEESIDAMLLDAERVGSES
jgi:dTDP-glucose 4,6-dehydratase